MGGTLVCAMLIAQVDKVGCHKASEKAGIGQYAYQLVAAGWQL